MNKKSFRRFVFEQATSQDSGEILAILEDASFKGNISLLYTRRPDAYRSLKQEGDDVDIIVARDSLNGKIAGFGACAVRQCFINGNEEKVGYLFGLRVARTYLKKFALLHRGYSYLKSLHEGKNISYYITTILEENRYAQTLLEKPRSFMPTYHPFGSYEVYALKASTRKKQSLPSSMCFRQATQGDLPSLIDFLHTQGKTYQFFPVIHAEDIRTGTFHHLTIEDFYLLHTNDGEILAAGVPWDQHHYKQYVVQGYNGLLQWLYPFSKLFPLFGFPSLPAPQSILQFFTLSFWAVKENQPEIFRHFLAQIAQLSRKNPFFLIGLHQSHPLRAMLQKCPHISYRSRVYLVSWPEHRSNPERLHKRLLPYLECGML